jgi:L-aminopeptidase/D-esterase-like protein
VVAGVRSEDGKSLADVRALIRSGTIGAAAPRAGGNTTIAVVATNAKLTKADMSRIALMADDALARTINPSHTTGDGDTVFALGTNRWTGEANVSIIGALAADVLSEAIVRAVSTAEPLGGLPSARSLGTAPARAR